MKRNLSFILYTLLFSVALVSCNLFIDDEYDGTIEDFVGSVPVHTGEGYDEPVTVVDNGCTVTYQYKSNVRVLSEEEQDRYIVYTKKDVTGGLIEIHYRASTPKDLLPVPGEILMSGVTDRFPWGCNHQVMNRFREGDVYIMVAGFTTLFDTFEELDINGDVTVEETRCISQDETNGSEGGILEKPSNTTRSDDDGFKVEFDDGDLITDEGLQLTTRFSGSKKINVGAFFYETTMSGKRNYVSVTSNFSFEDFSIRNGNFLCKYTEIDEYELEMKVSGGWKGNLLGDTKHLGSKVLVFGPVIVVLFADLYYSLDLSIALSKVYKEHHKTKTTYVIDLYNLTMTKEVKKIIDEPMAFKEEAIEGTLSFEFGLSLGLGLYGKVITARILVGPVISLKASKPLKTEVSEGQQALDLSMKPGLLIDIKVDVTIGVFLDLSLRAAVGAFISDAQEEKLEEFCKGLETSNSYYKHLVDIETDFFDQWNKDLTPKEKARQKLLGTDISTTKTWNFPIKSWAFSWYPSLKENSFKVNPLWDKTKKRYNFTAEMTIDDDGIFPISTDCVPCLMLTTKDKKGIPKYIFAQEGGTECKLKSDRTYHFNIKDMEDDVKYLISPCYFEYPVPTFIPYPLAFDKGEEWSLSTPVVMIDRVEPRIFLVTNTPAGVYDDKYYDEQEKKYEYQYEWEVKTYITVLGTDYMKDWWIKEWMNKDEYNHYQVKEMKDTKKIGKGKYELTWSFQKFSHKHESDKALDIMFEPCFTLKGDRFEQIYSVGELEYHLEGGFLKSRAATSGNQESSPPSDGDKVIRRLDAIKKDGEFIWQRKPSEKSLRNI